MFVHPPVVWSVCSSVRLFVHFYIQPSIALLVRPPALSSIRPRTRSFLDPPVDWCIHLFIHLSVRPSVRPSAGPYFSSVLHSLVDWSIRSFVLLFMPFARTFVWFSICLSAGPLVRSHLPLSARRFVHSFVPPYDHSFVRPFYCQSDSHKPGHGTISLLT